MGIGRLGSLGNCGVTVDVFFFFFFFFFVTVARRSEESPEGQVSRPRLLRGQVARS